MEKLIYLYGIIPKSGNESPTLPSMNGLDDHHELYSIPFGEIDAVVCDLDQGDYGEKELEKKTNDTKWVHEKAFHHHEALMKLYENYPIIPMKFCTIYSSVQSLQDTISENKPKMIELLKKVEDKEEWILKIYCDTAKVREEVAAHNLKIDAKKKEINELSPGRQYLEKRKLDQFIDQETDKEKEAFSSRLHDHLVKISLENEIKKNWNKDVTGRNEEMCWNSVYMLEKSTVDKFLANVKEVKDKWKASGWQIEVTGPWPSYHFAKIS